MWEQPDEENAKSFADRGYSYEDVIFSSPWVTIWDGGMPVFIKSYDGRMIGMDCSPNTTIETVKLFIQGYDGAATESQRLTFNGRSLDDGKFSLKEYGIAKEAVVQLSVLLPNGQGRLRFVEDISSSSNAALLKARTVAPSDTPEPLSPPAADDDDYTLTEDEGRNLGAKLREELKGLEPSAAVGETNGKDGPISPTATVADGKATKDQTADKKS